MTSPIPDRVAERAATRYEVAEDGCWISTYSVASHGYAQIGWQERGKVQMTLVHRAAWVHYTGSQPVDTIDHTCHERRCVRRDHLRELSNIDNSRRNSDGRDFPVGFLCAQGHGPEHQGPVKRRTKTGAPRIAMTCKQCIREAQARYRERYPERKAESQRRYRARKRES